MTLLSAASIGDRLDEVNPERRLVISPILERKLQLKESQASIDVRLGRAFALMRPWLHGVAGEISSTDAGDGDEPFLEDFVLEYGQPLIIHPHQFVLGRTLEYVRMPADLSAQVIGRSSWGRRGLIVATASIVHPGFAGAITLELKNVGEVPLAVYPLDCIAQLAIFDVDGGCQPAEPSQFFSAFAPALGAARDSATLERIRATMKNR